METVLYFTSLFSWLPRLVSLRKTRAHLGYPVLKAKLCFFGLVWFL